ncbi:glycogen synthase GlgA [Azomonas macrocytogenes]|uniref:Glycogen synthase n=1 Tax=Azomonas macrocytogenes TaxID=69962 RepID=A0A839T807_AZOMA|nr:glycogen synthase GlgA [Azomonas macrocytogenes]MBB3104384.1 starch synthase [Azomonas macrocytogenes]
MSNVAESAKALNLPQQSANIAFDTKPRLHISSTQEHKKKILFITPELSDLIKTGGLGEYSGALPRALSEQHDVRVLIPGYAQVMNQNLPIRTVGTLEAHAGIPACRIGRLDLPDGLIVYVLICPELYEREGTPYCDTHGNGWSDNDIRFARLSLAAAEIAAGNACIRWVPDLLHAHDWPTGLVPAYLRWRNIATPCIFTIHNLGYQGTIEMSQRRRLGIPESACHMEEMEFYGRLSTLKAGIAYATHVTTVSATYAEEITTPEFGYGLEGFLRKKAAQGLLTGIRNGIDDSWEPTIDPHLVKGFGVRNWAGKAANAVDVRRLFGLVKSSGPLFAVVSRLVYQKGMDLTLEIADNIIARGGQIVIIGSGEPQIEAQLCQLAERYPGHIGIRIGFDDTVARRIYAASDFLLMPSRYEPCGLSQMYAQRFASLPIARRTGGLADTIEDGLSGFLFDKPDAASYDQAIQRAFGTYRHPELLNAMRSQAMTTEFFWHQSVKPYNQLFQQLLGAQAMQATF